MRPRDGQLMYVCAAPNHCWPAGGAGSMTSHASVLLTSARVDSATLVMGVNPLALAGRIDSDSAPWECADDAASTAPAVVVVQAPGASNPRTSLLGNAARVLAS